MNKQRENIYALRRELLEGKYPALKTRKRRKSASSTHAPT